MANSFDPLELEYLLAHLDRAARSVEGLGFHGPQAKAPDWMKVLVSGLLSAAEGALPDKDLFKDVRSVAGNTVLPSQLVNQAANCWELLFIINVGRQALSTFLARDQQGGFGFVPRQA